MAKYIDDGHLCHISELTVNRDPQQYSANDNDHDVALFMVLLTSEYGGDTSQYWDKAFH